jgi:hypothetical protein
VKAYRVGWMVVCTVLCVVGVCVVFVLSPASLLFLFLSFAIVGPILTPAVTGDVWDRPPGERTGVLVTGAVVSGTVAGAVVGLAVILGVGVLPLVLVAVASSPYAVNVYRRWVVSAPTPPPERPVTPAPTRPSRPPEHPGDQLAAELRRLTDEQLCQRWRTSYPALQMRPSATSVLEVVEQRERYLDELQRRNARGLTAWLASGARAAGNPLPYLAADRVEGHAINWDDLTRGQDR